MNTHVAIYQQTILETRYDREDYGQAFRMLRSALGELPQNSLVVVAAQLLTACRNHTELRRNIPEDLNTDENALLEEAEELLKATQSTKGLSTP